VRLQTSQDSPRHPRNAANPISETVGEQGRRIPKSLPYAAGTTGALPVYSTVYRQKSGWAYPLICIYATVLLAWC